MFGGSTRSYTFDILSDLQEWYHTILVLGLSALLKAGWAGSLTILQTEYHKYTKK